MILAWEELPNLAGRVVMVDGSFDPIHEGHIAYFAEAAKLGKPVLCNIATDDWTSRKHPVLLPQASRSIVLDAIRFIDYVHSATHPTLEVLEQLRPIAYVKGSDWRDRGGIPAAEAELCNGLGIQVVYVETVLNSSTQILNRLRHG